MEGRVCIGEMYDGSSCGLRGYPIRVQGVPFGSTIPFCKKYEVSRQPLHLLLLHQYLWMGDAKHPKAKRRDRTNRNNKRLKSLKDYDVVQGEKSIESIGGIGFDFGN